MEPIDLQIAEIVARHPEYHRVVEQSQESLTRDWAPEDGETNPFLHMGMHLAIREQVATDRPSGIARVHADLGEEAAAVQSLLLTGKEHEDQRPPRRLPPARRRH